MDDGVAAVHPDGDDNGNVIANPNYEEEEAEEEMVEALRLHHPHYDPMADPLGSLPRPVPPPYFEGRAGRAARQGDEGDQLAAEAYLV